jgi:hypothetical protein
MTSDCDPEENRRECDLPNTKGTGHAHREANQPGSYEDARRVPTGMFPKIARGTRLQQAEIANAEYNPDAQSDENHIPSSNPSGKRVSKECTGELAPA